MVEKNKWLFKGILLILFLCILTIGYKVIKNGSKDTEVNVDNTKAGTAEEFGAKVNDNIDDTEAIQKAINKYGTIILNSGTYDINKTLNIRKSINLISKDRNNPAIIRNNGELLSISAKAPVRYKGNINCKIAKDDNKIKMSKEFKIKKNDLIHIKSDKLWYWNNRDSLYKGEIHKVANVDSKYITLSEVIYDSYNDDENLEITIYKPSKIVIKNIKFINKVPTNNIMIETNGFQDSEYISNTIEGSKEIGLLIRNNYNALVKENKITLNTTKDINTGYGIQDYGGTINKILSNEVYKMRRGIDISGITPSHCAIVEENKVYGDDASNLATGSSGYGSHSTAVNATYRNNYSYGLEYGFVLRGKDELVEDNTVEENEKSFVEVAYGTGSIIRNNNRKGNQGNENFLNVFKDYNGKAKIINNKAESTKSWISTSNADIYYSNNKK